MRRSIAFAALAAFMGEFKAALAVRSVAEREEAISQIAPYRSRGKGRGTPSRNYLRPANNAGRGMPHQGRQERMRRLVGGFYAPRGNHSFTKAAVLSAIERGHVTTVQEIVEMKYAG